MELVTKDDLEVFRMRLIADLSSLLKTNNELPIQAEWVKSKVVREMLSVSPGTLQNLRIAGKINPVRIEGTWYYSTKEVNGLFKEGADGKG